MSTPAVLALLLFLLGFALLFFNWRAGLLVMVLGMCLLQWEARRRKRAKVRKLKELRDDLQEQNWLKKSGWFSRRGIT